MKQIRELSDERLRGFCVYCGGPFETRDHIPPRVFLDKPYPINLPVVPACKICNQKMSIDEEYVACFLECVISGSTTFQDIERDKIANILKRKPKLVAKLKELRQTLLDNRTWFRVESNRIRDMIIKLARGHIAFEQSQSHLEEPSAIFFSPFIQMDAKQIEAFESILPNQIFPEVGSRGMQRLIEQGSGWIIAQPQRYRYLTLVDLNKIIVRFVIREYLACQVTWFMD